MIPPLQSHYGKPGRFLAPVSARKRTTGCAMSAVSGIVWCAACIIAAMLMLPPVMPAQESGQPEQSVKFKKEELTQMLAPIALYPDPLITQMLMASTYPLEIVEAERWLRQNKGLKGDALDNALKEKAWDPSVKSLCHFPEVLFAMSEKLDQTRKLGDAFLGQQDDVMDTIQELRRKAEGQGNLRTTEQQKVIVEEDLILIEPADPQVIYVPLYNPYYVFGPWWYPAYPPYFWYYPPGVYITGGYISFGAGFFVGIGVYSWSWFDWHHHHIYVDHHKAGRFHKGDRHRHDTDRSFWRHDPGHRKGVAYRDAPTSRRFGSGWPGRPVVSPEMRGYPEGAERRGMGPARQTIERQRIQKDSGRFNIFRGIGSGSLERRASERGAISRQSPGALRQRGGSGSQGAGPRAGEAAPGRSGGSRIGVSPGGGGAGGSRGGGGTTGRGGMGGSRR